MNAVHPKQFTFSSTWIQYADHDLIIANKPSGLLSVPGRGVHKQESLLTHLASKYPNIKIVHRLDMDTSGLIVLALSPNIHRQLSIQFQERQVHKTYHAICAGMPLTSQGVIKLPIRCNWDKRPLQMVDFKYGKASETHWRRIKQYKNCFLAELTPITGRSHQLRLHMKSLGHPILGDNLYADHISYYAAKRLLLHATTLSFTHPTTLKTIHIHSSHHLETNINNLSI